MVPAGQLLPSCLPRSIFHCWMASLSFNKNNFPWQPEQALSPVRGGRSSSEPIKRVLMRGEWKTAADPPPALDTMHCHLIKSWWCSKTEPSATPWTLGRHGGTAGDGGVAGTSWTWHHSLVLDADNGLPASWSHGALCHFKLLCDGLYGPPWTVKWAEAQLWMRESFSLNAAGTFSSRLKWT